MNTDKKFTGENGESRAEGFSVLSVSFCVIPTLTVVPSNICVHLCPSVVKRFLGI
ncbi:MAG: hypothetical protein ACI8V5_002574 [Limisphaerales bacterium]|jgi:hypothetical protein